VKNWKSFVNVVVRYGCSTSSRRNRANSGSEPFEPCEGTLTQWYQIFEEACATSRVRPEPVQDGAIVRATNAKRAYFLSSIGRRAYVVLEESCLPDLPNTKPIPELVEMLKAHFESAGTRAAYDLEFSTREQQHNESVVQYIAKLQSLASRCDFGEFWESDSSQTSKWTAKTQTLAETQRRGPNHFKPSSHAACQRISKPKT